MDFNLIKLLLVLVVAWFTGIAATRLGYPSILGELAAGIVFGPALLGWIHPSEGLKVLAEVGVFLMMLYIGMEVDYRDLAKATKAGLLTAAGGFTVPLTLGFIATLAFGFSVQASLFLGLAMGVTSLATKSRIVVDLGLLGTRIANVLFAAALISDTAALVMFALIMGLIGNDGLLVLNLLVVVIKAVLFFGFTIAIGMRVFPWIGRLLGRLAFTERTANFTLVVMIGLVFAELAHLSGLHSILGAFLAGMFIRSEILQRKLSHEVTSIIHDLSLGFLAPIFFVSAGFHVSFGVFATELPLLLTIIFLAAFGKILGATVFYLRTGNGWREGLTIGAGMNGHGAVEIIIAGIALEKGIINEDLFSILIFMAFVTTSSVPFLMKWGVHWLRSRDELAPSNVARDGVLIVGAPPLARLLAQEIQGYEKVMLIDSSPRRCALAERAGIPVFEGNALATDVLDLAGADTARVLVAMTSNHEVNSVASQRATEYFGIPHVYALHDGSAEFTARPSGGKKDHPLRPVFHRPYNLETWNHRVFTNDFRRVVVDIRKAQPADQALDEFGEPDHVLPLVVFRKQRSWMPGGLDRLEPGDRLVVLQRAAREEATSDPFANLVRAADAFDVPAGTTLEDLFTESAARLAPLVHMSEPRIRNLFIKREEDSSTVIFPGVAIPHIIIDGEHQTELQIIRARDGVPFYGDDTPARIIFVIAGTRDERRLHLRILSAIAQLFQDPTFEERWMAAPTPHDLHTVILETERSRT